MESVAHLEQLIDRLTPFGMTFDLADSVVARGAAGPNAIAKPVTAAVLHPAIGGQVFQNQIDSLELFRPGGRGQLLNRLRLAISAPTTFFCNSSTAAAAFFPASTPGWW